MLLAYFRTRFAALKRPGGRARQEANGAEPADAGPAPLVADLWRVPNAAPLNAPGRHARLLVPRPVAAAARGRRPVGPAAGAGSRGLAAGRRTPAGRRTAGRPSGMARWSSAAPDSDRPRASSSGRRRPRGRARASSVRRRMAAGMTGRAGRRMRRDRRMRQAQLPRLVGQPAPGRLTLQLRPFFPHLVQLRHLATDLLPLRLGHPHHPQVPSRDPVGRELVQRHRHVAMIDHRDIPRDRDVPHHPDLLGIGHRRPQRDVLAAAARTPARTCTIHCGFCRTFTTA